MKMLIEASIIVGLIGGLFSLVVGVIAVAWDAIKNRREVR